MFFANLLAILLTIQFVSCSVFVPEPCPKVTNTKNLDFKKIVGDWYLLARKTGDFTEDDKCIHHKISLLNDRTLQIKVSYINVKGQLITTVVNDSIKENNPGEVKIDKFATIDGLWGPYNKTILVDGYLIDTDYTNYVAIYSCYQRDNFWVSEKKDNFMILTKSRSFDSIKMLIPVFGKMSQLNFDANRLGFFYNEPNCPN